MSFASSLCLFRSHRLLSDPLAHPQSTVASVIILLTQEWLSEHRSSERKSTSRATSVADKDRDQDAVIAGESVVRRARSGRQHSNATRGPRPDKNAPRAMSWQVINNVLRVIRNGLEVKEAVDKAIDRAGQHINLRDCIEEARGASTSSLSSSSNRSSPLSVLPVLTAQAAEATDPALKRQFVQEGLHHLRRYFDLVIVSPSCSSCLSNPH